MVRHGEVFFRDVAFVYKHLSTAFQVSLTSILSQAKLIAERARL